MPISDFSQLTEAIPSVDYTPTSQGNLVIADDPSPFVAPDLKSQSNSDSPFSAELLFVRAPAAVGKSTIAQRLSAIKNVPLLDLAEVPVATGSLDSLLSKLNGPGDPKSAFHEGRLPIVVDALDEGRLLSGENSFQSFLETTSTFLSQNRGVTDRPKLILFGREEAINLTQIAFEEFGSATQSLVDVEFFGSEKAFQLVQSYAEENASEDSAYLTHPEPASDVITAYFDAIEEALDLESDNLWSVKRGKAFAGYAPVLEAVGSLLAEMENFKEVANQLRTKGRQEAWGVIDTVLDEIMKRERRKLENKLSEKISSPIPEEAYDRHEQLTLLTQLVHGKELQPSGRVQLPPSDQTAYTSMVERQIREHPFERGRGFPNDVLGSVVLAHAVQHDLLHNTDLTMLADVAKQPFVWRWVSQSLEDGTLLDGRYVGYLLRSFWNDPMTENLKVDIRSKGESSANIHLTYGREDKYSFECTLPLTLNGEVRKCDIRTNGDVKLEGYAPQESKKVIYLYDEVCLICDTAEVFADSVTLNGEVWLEAEQVVTQRRLELTVKNGSQVGWGGEFAQMYPWSQYNSTLTRPGEEESTDRLTELIEECKRRFSPEVRSLILSRDFSPAEGEGKKRLGWIERDYPEDFPKLINLMIAAGLASEKDADARPGPKVQVRFKHSWNELYEALQNPDGTSEQLRKFFKSARDEINTGAESIL